jgi:very-short-patch-repair endonuclease
MRENLTPTESKLEEGLSKANNLPKFLSQHVIYPYIVDFVCLENMLIIEVDGSSHDGSAASDELRDYDLQKAGYKVLRFSAGEVALSLTTVMDAIKFECSFRAKRPTAEPKSISKKPLKKQMIVPLPRVVYEEPIRQVFHSRAGKVRIRKALAPGEKIRAVCAICKNPIADADLRVRHKGSSEQVEWAHKSCTR